MRQGLRGCCDRGSDSAGTVAGREPLARGCGPGAGNAQGLRPRPAGRRGGEGTVTPCAAGAAWGLDQGSAIRRRPVDGWEHEAAAVGGDGPRSSNFGGPTGRREGPLTRRRHWGGGAPAGVVAWP